jgi:type IV pilus assembly protein PilO
MADIKQTERKLKIALIVLVGLNLIALGLQFSPLVGSVEARLQELDQARLAMQQKRRAVEPLNGLDKKIVIASQQIDRFYDHRLPGVDSAISENLSKLASDTGVQIAQIKYKFDDPQSVGVRPVEVETTLSGDYLQLVKFINSLERDELFFVVDSVDLGGEQTSTVRLRLKLRTFLRTGA